MATVPKAATAVFVGTEFDSISGRGGDDGTPNPQDALGRDRLAAWRQEGLGDRGRAREADDCARRRRDPQVPAQGQPCLILMDELMNYVSRNRKSGMAAQLYNFLQNLSEVARGHDNVVLAVSDPGVGTGNDRGGPVGFRAVQEAARPAGQGHHHVGRGGDFGDHPPPACSSGSACPTMPRRRSPNTPTGSGTTGSKSPTGSPSTMPARHLRPPIPSIRRCFRCSSGNGRRCPASSRPAACCAMLALWVSKSLSGGLQGRPQGLC